MLKKIYKTILKSHYMIAGIIVFIILLIIGFILDLPVGETILGSAGLAIVGMLIYWWKEVVW